jgi:hypothetical protein
LIRSALEARLAEHAVRFGAARRRRLRKLMAAEGLELGSSSSWRDPHRVRSAAAPAPGTFTRAEPGAAPDQPSGTRAIAVPKSPAAVVSPPLPSSPPPALVPISPTTSAERLTRRLGVEASASIPPPPPARVKRPRWIPVAIGFSLACILVGVVFVLSVRAGRSDVVEPSAEQIETMNPEPAPAPLTQVEPVIEEPSPASPEVESPPPPVETSEPPKSPARAGQPRPGAAKVQSRTPPKSRSKPCTPDRFDYPACLGR